MKWLPDTIASRTILVLMAGLGAIIVLAQLLYQQGIRHELSHAQTERLADRLLSLAETITSVAPELRDETAHRLSGGAIELHWARQPLTTQGGELEPDVVGLRDELLRRWPQLRGSGLVLGTSRTQGAHENSPEFDDAHTTLMSLRLADDSWLNVTLVKTQPPRATSPSLITSIVLSALGVALVSILMSRWLTRPLDDLAEASRRLFVTADSIPLQESGTREVRTLAAAINELQLRISRLIDDRTGMLAAVSHDLRTPLTRLRLRVANIADAGLRSSIEADLDEMDEMIEATLEFLRTDKEREPIQPVDIRAILDTISANAADAGHTVEVSAPRHLVIDGRHLALKRALGNVVQNAVKYAGSARVTASIEKDQAQIVVSDDGPGVPHDQLEAVFAPFYRVEKSRARTTGGHGLGLTVARSIARSHGGDVVLSNRIPHGLDAVVTLARQRTIEITEMIDTSSPAQ